jgi:hypothetical protein
MARILSFIFGLLLIASLVYGAFELIRIGLTAFAALDKTLAAAIIAASATVIVSVTTVVLGNVYASRIQVQKENRDRKIPVYEHLLTFFFRFMNSEKTGEVFDEVELVKFGQEFNRQFMVWGSDAVVSAYVKWRMYITRQTSPPDPKESLFLLEDLIFAIRRDLGYKNNGLTAGDILAVFVNDVQSLLPRANR